jgi:hypothetical protein
MDLSVIETLTHLLLRLSEAEPPALLWGRTARRHFGAGFERLLDGGILIEQRPATEWPVCGSCECDLDMRPLTRIADRTVAACPLDRGNDEVLEDVDLQIFQLDHRAFVHEIARVSGFGEPPSEISPGLWSLGMSKIDIEAFLTFSDVVARQPQIIDSIWRVARGRRRMLIAPTLTASESIAFDRADIRMVGLSECLRADPAHTIPTLDIGGLDVAQPEPRLIVQIGKQTVVLDGTELKLPPRSFRLLHYLAQQAVAGRALCERRDIEKFVWSTVVSDKAVADAVRDLRNKIKPILPKGMTAEQFIENRPPASYMIALAADEIRIDD